MTNLKKRLWFDESEYLARLARIQTELAALNQDGLLLFSPESVTWCTGFFTRGYSSFQFAIVPVEGSPVLVCRDVEAYYLDRTCAFPGRVLWSDSDDKNKIAIEAVRSAFGKRARLGIELFAWPLSVARYDALRTGLPGIEWYDGSSLVSQMRLKKSPAEIAYQRRAARAAEAGMAAGVEAATETTSEREIAAIVCAAMIRAGSDRPGPGVLSSGARALHLHGGYTDRKLQRGDTVQLETTPHVMHYHARFMRPIKVGEATDEDHQLFSTLQKIQDQALAAVAPDVAATVPDSIYRDGVLSAGLKIDYTNKTFYSIGLMFEPTGGEPLEAHPAAAWSFESNMVFHTYVLAQGFGVSETVLVTEDSCERLTNFPRELLIGGRQYRY